MTGQVEISAQCDFKSHYLSVQGAKIHYYDEGAGDPMVFLHGMPTSAYLWRNIIPVLSPTARCIAPDLIGMGKSDKPDIAYRIFDHVEYIEAFIESLDLQNITLVLHGWGSVVGLEYARRHPDKIKAIAFYEAHLKPVTEWHQLSLPVQQLASMLRNPKAARHAVVDQNYLIKRLLPSAVVRKLSQQELDCYSAPFTTTSARLPLWQYLNDLPLGNGPKDVVDLISVYSDWLQQTTFPKLLLYAIPGFITTVDMVQWAKAHLKNLTMVVLNDAMHFAQESAPDQFAKALLSWYREIQ